MAIKMPFRIFRRYRDETTFQYTTKMIAFILLSVFLIGLVGAGIFSAVENDDNWFGLYKEGFLILAGAITTIIGYYFGAKRTESLESGFRVLEKEKELAEKERNVIADSTAKSDKMQPGEQPQLEVDVKKVEGIEIAKKEGN